MASEFSIDGYSFRSDGDGVYPAGRNFNFADEKCLKAIEKAVSLYQSDAKPAFVYLAYSDNRKMYKIGKSLNVKQRLRDVGCKLIHQIGCFNEKDAYQLEAVFHTYFGLKVHDYDIEYFNLTDDDVAWFGSFMNSNDVNVQYPADAIHPRSPYHPRHERRRLRREQNPHPLIRTRK